MAASLQQPLCWQVEHGLSCTADTWQSLPPNCVCQPLYNQLFAARSSDVGRGFKL